VTPQRKSRTGASNQLGDPIRAWAARLAGLEGRQVSVALDDCTRIDDCQLVAGCRQGVETLWLFANGADRFVSLDRVIDVWEAP
jgi:hypothetical protein